MLERNLQDIDTCRSISELKAVYQRIIESYGFQSYNFMDTGMSYKTLPFFDGTSGKRWEDEYQSAGFVEIDPYISAARRTHQSFVWSDLPIPRSRTGYTPKAVDLMEAAQDHGFREGLIIPYHFVDKFGRTYSSLVVLFWQDHPRFFLKSLNEKRTHIQVLTLYWVQRMVDFVYDDFHYKAVENTIKNSSILALSDREKEVLRWTALGKTSAEVADVLELSTHTVRDHWKAILSKTGASTRTAAAMFALQAGLIDI